MVKWPVNAILERYWAKSDRWFVGMVIKERRVQVGAKKQRQVRVHFLNEKTSGNDAWLQSNSKELREHPEYLQSFSSNEGHVEDDSCRVPYGRFTIGST